MQSYLGEYQGSRKKPIEKLVRALKSFQANTINSELILISDNCELTNEVYQSKFSNDKRIIFHYLKDDSKRMYEEDNTGKFFRGYPRQIGLDISTGDVVTYMDSDDFILPDYLSNLYRLWQINDKYFWFTNNCWFENVKILESQPPGYFLVFEELSINNKLKIDNLESEWILSKLRPKKMISSPALFSHRKDKDIKWSDCIYNLENEKSEDMLFINSYKDKYPNGAFITVPGYVRCHLRDYWDY
jgi:glycosyltransferase involved in cell wall biosynthesis